MVMRYRQLFALVLLVALTAASGCNSDPEARKQRFLELATKYFDRGQYDEASILYRKALQQDGRFGPAYCGLAEASLKLGRYSDAVPAYRRCFELDPTNLRAFEQVAEIELMIASRPDAPPNALQEVIQLIETAAARFPDSFEVLRIKGLAARTQGQLLAAVDLFDQAARLRPDEPTVAVALVESLTASGRLGEAEAHARKAIARDPAFGAMYDLLYLICYRTQRAADAEAVMVEKADRNPKNAAYAIDLAAHYYRAGKREAMDSAIQKRLLDHLDRFPNGYEAVGDFFVRIGEGVRAATYYEAGRAGNRDEKRDKELTYKIIVALFSARQWNQASEVVQKALEQDPSDARVRSFRAVLRMRTGDHDEILGAVRDLDQVVSELPDNAVLRYRLGEAQALAGDYRKALLQFGEALRLEPNYLQPKYGMLRVHLARNELAQATIVAQEVLDRYPNDPTALLSRGIASVGLRRYREARADLDQLIAQNQFVDDATFQLARLETLTKQYGVAERRLRDMGSRHPADDRVNRGLADLYLAQGKREDARRVLAARAEHSPQRLDYRLDLARLSATMGETERAIEELEFIVEKRPGYRPAQTLLGELLLRSGETERARRHFLAAIEGDRPSAEALVHLGTLLARESKYDQARVYFEKALAVQPNSPTVSNNLAYVLAETNTELDLALTYAQRAAAAAPGSASARSFGCRRSPRQRAG